MNIGFNNQVAWWKVSAILGYSRGRGGQRLIEVAEKFGKLSDATQGRRRRSMILTDDGLVILSSVTPETLILRLNKLRRKGEKDDDD